MVKEIKITKRKGDIYTRKGDVSGKSGFSYTRKSQEEMVGFVIVLVLIVVSGLLVLLLQKPKQTDSRNDQISNLLYSMASYSSEYQDKPLGEVIEECDLCNEKTCEACKIAEKEIAEIMSVSQKQGGFVVGKQIKGYIFNASGYKQLIIQEPDGELKGNKIGSFVVIQSGKDIIATLHFYY